MLVWIKPDDTGFHAGHFERSGPHRFTRYIIYAFQCWYRTCLCRNNPADYPGAAKSGRYIFGKMQDYIEIYRNFRALFSTDIPSIVSNPWKRMCIVNRQLVQELPLTVQRNWLRPLMRGDGRCRCAFSGFIWTASAAWERPVVSFGCWSLSNWLLYFWFSRYFSFQTYCRATMTAIRSEETPCVILFLTLGDADPPPQYTFTTTL